MNNKWKVPVLALLCCLIWGFATPCIKIGYQQFQINSGDTASIILFAGLRFFLAGILTLLVASLLEKRFLMPRSRSSWGIAALQGMLQTFGQYMFFYIGLAHTVGAKGPIFSGTNCFFSVLIAGLIFRMEKVTPRKLLGCAVGFLGILVLNMNKQLELTFTLTGEGFLLLATILYSLGFILLKFFSGREDTMLLTAWQFIIGGGAMVLVGAVGGGTLRPLSFASWGILAALSLIASAATMIWSLLLKKHPVSQVTVFSLTIPMFGVGLSLLFLSEPVSLGPVLLSLVLVTAGILLVNRPGKAGMSS